MSTLVGSNGILSCALGRRAHGGFADLAFHLPGNDIVSYAATDAPKIFQELSMPLAWGTLLTLSSMLRFTTARGQARGPLGCRSVGDDGCVGRRIAGSVTANDGSSRFRFLATVVAVDGSPSRPWRMPPRCSLQATSCLRLVPDMPFLSCRLQESRPRPSSLRVSPVHPCPKPAGPAQARKGTCSRARCLQCQTSPFCLRIACSDVPDLGPLRTCIGSWFFYWRLRSGEVVPCTAGDRFLQFCSNCRVTR